MSIITLILASASAATPPPPSFDKPETTLTRHLGLSDDVTPPSPRTETCSVYPDFAVVSLSDPSLMGDRISIRPRKGRSPDALCAPEASAGAIDLTEAYGSPRGVAGPYVVVAAPDDFGVESAFEVYAAATGKRVLAGSLNANEPVTVVRDHGAVGLAFYTLLKSFECPLADRDGECWIRYLADNGVPKAQGGATPPPCPKGAGPWQVTLPARIADLAHPELQYIGGPGTCDPTP